MSAPDDPMWPEFQPLWADLQKAGASFLVAGGYGLLLKQHWLRSQPDIPTIVPLPRWRDVNPRVTKDLDIVVGLELIASDAAQASISDSLKRHGFKATLKNPRWQFEKKLGMERTMLVEFHARLPDPADPALSADRIRVKHKPSLGEAGIHGRQNAQAVGCDFHPFRFDIEGVGICVPNPVAWCIMKLAAMHDRWKIALVQEDDPRVREFQRAQAIKHAQDILRILALTTRGESDLAPDAVKGVRSSVEFENAVAIREEFFTTATGWGSLVAAPMWQVEDLSVMLRTLSTWFQKPAS